MLGGNYRYYTLTFNRDTAVAFVVNLPFQKPKKTKKAGKYNHSLLLILPCTFQKEILSAHHHFLPYVT